MKQRLNSLILSLLPRSGMSKANRLTASFLPLKESLTSLQNLFPHRARNIWDKSGTIGISPSCLRWIFLKQKVLILLLMKHLFASYGQDVKLVYEKTVAIRANKLQ